MPVWTLVIGSQPVYAFAADDQTTAERHLEDGGLKDDLAYYEDDEGSPLWDGEGSLSLRLATPNEHRTWRQAQEHPSLEGMLNRQDPEDCATYLVSIHDPADDDVVEM